MVLRNPRLQRHHTEQRHLLGLASAHRWLSPLKSRHTNHRASHAPSSNHHYFRNLLGAIRLAADPLQVASLLSCRPTARRSSACLTNEVHFRALALLCSNLGSLAFQDAEHRRVGLCSRRTTPLSEVF